MTEYSDCVEGGKAISSQRQIAIPGVDTCESCAKKGLTLAEKEWISRQFVILSE